MKLQYCNVKAGEIIVVLGQEQGFYRTLTNDGGPWWQVFFFFKEARVSPKYQEDEDYPGNI